MEADVSSTFQVFFTVVLAAAAGAANAQNNGDAPINTTLCELVRTPERFNGKMVQVRAKSVSTFEWGGLVDPSCSAQLLADGDGFPGLSGKRGEYAFFGSFSDSIILTT